MSIVTSNEVFITVRRPELEVIIELKKPDGTPAAGAEVVLMTKNVDVWKDPFATKTISSFTDSSGKAYFACSDLESVSRKSLSESEWILMAYYDNSDLAVSKDGVKLLPDRSYIYRLKKYEDAPTYYLKIELNNIIGAELWSGLIAQIESLMLSWSGFKVVKTEGVGTKTINIYFKPPYSKSSPLIIAFGMSTKFVVALIALIVAFVIALIVFRISFGEVAPTIAIGSLMLLAALALLFIMPKRREKE